MSLTAQPSGTVSREVLVQNRAGIHTRVSANISKLVKSFDAEVKMFKGNYSADCQRAIELLSLGAAQGETVRLEAIGNDAQLVIDALLEMFYARFNEDDE